jgi:hypothetical protein
VSSTTWTPRAVASEAARCRLEPWRAVEAQHIASTRRLVDSLAEQALLEQILDASKPPALEKLHYLLSTPFRYPPWQRGSRFRSPADPGVFYAAEERRTACAELGYWRWRFVTDSRGLSELGPAPQTLFQVRIEALAVDLRARPFVRRAGKWTDPHSYQATQAFALTARAAGVPIIRYESVRDPAKGGCAAILDPGAFAKAAPLSQQTWLLTVTRNTSTWQRDSESFEFAWA